MMLKGLSSAKTFAQAHLTMPIFYVVPDPNWALGLEDILPNYHIVCFDDSWTADYLSEEGFSVYCVERERSNSASVLQNAVRQNTEKHLISNIQYPISSLKRSASGMLRLVEVQEFIKKQSEGVQPHILVFKTSPALEKICQELGYRLLAVDSKLNRKFEDKISFATELAKSGAGRMPMLVGRMKEFSYDDLSDNYGDELVIQFARGFAGNSTVFIRDKEEFQSFARDNNERKVKIAPFIRGRSLTIDACVTRHGIAMSNYFMQIIGCMECNKYEGGTSGNDYAFDYGFSQKIEQSIFAMTKDIGEYMQTIGYRGIFGLDMIVGEESGEVFVLENNARLVASVPVLTRLQVESGELPLLLLHLAELAGIDYECDLETLNDTLHHRHEAAQLILRNTSDKPQNMQSFWQSGGYTRENSELLFKKKAYHLGQINPREILLNIGKQGRKIDINIEYANMQFDQSILDASGTLGKESMEIVHFLKKESFGFDFSS